VGHLTDQTSGVDAVHSVTSPVGGAPTTLATNGRTLLDDLLGGSAQGNTTAVTAPTTTNAFPTQSLAERIQRLVAEKTDKIQSTLDQGA
jgi:hypothetical protein